MAGDQPMRRLGVLLLLPTLGEHVLFFRLQHWELPDLLEIPGEIPFAGNGRNRKRGHSLNLPHTRVSGDAAMTRTPGSAMRSMANCPRRKPYLYSQALSSLKSL